MDQEIVQEIEKKIDTPASEPVATAPLEPSNEPDLIAEAKSLRDENKKLLDQLREERKKIERATSEIIMSGRSHAIPTKTETEDEKWEREAKIRYAGTGLDPTPTRK